MDAKERYGTWHTGVRRVRSSGEWIPFVEDEETGERLFARSRLATREDAAVAASDLLTTLRNGGTPECDTESEDWSEEWRTRAEPRMDGTPQG